MPRASFSASAFADTAKSGLGNIASAITGDTYEKARESEIKLQSKLAQELSQQRAHDSTTRLNNAKAGQEERQLEMQRPEAVLDTALSAHNIPLDEAGAIAEYQRTGQLGGKYRAPSDGMGPVAGMPDYAGAGPEIPGLGPSKVMPGVENKLGSIARMVSTTNRAVTLGDKSVENAAKADRIARDDELAGRVLNGGLDPTLFAASQYARNGSAPYHFNEYGTGNNLTGKLDASGSAADRFGKYRTAETAAAKARAEASYAAADNSRASAAKTRSELERGIKSGDIQIVTDADGNITLVNKLNGISRPATDAEGRALKAKGGGVKMTEDQGKATGWLIQAENAYKNMLAATDPETGSPSAATPGPGDAVASMPYMGAVGNWLRSGNRQKFMQGSSSLSEALLRAATGAGVNKDEAKQKIQELTPQWGDGADVIKQKTDAIPLYIESLKVRAGPGAAAAAKVGAPTADTPPPAKATVSNW